MYDGVQTAWPALQFALEFYRFTGHDEVKIRAAVHIGEVTIVDEDMYGVMINYTSRLLKAVPNGPIIVSDKAMQNVRSRLGDNFKEHMRASGPSRLPAIFVEFPASEQLLGELDRSRRLLLPGAVDKVANRPSTLFQNGASIDCSSSMRPITCAIPEKSMTSKSP